MCDPDILEFYLNFTFWIKTYLNFSQFCFLISKKLAIFKSKLNFLNFFFLFFFNFFFHLHPLFLFLWLYFLYFLSFRKFLIVLIWRESSWFFQKSLLYKTRLIFKSKTHKLNVISEPVLQSRPKHGQRHCLAEFRRRGTTPPMLACSNVRARLFFHHVIAPCIERRQQQTWSVLGFAPEIFPMREATNSGEIPRQKVDKLLFSRVQLSFPKSTLSHLSTWFSMGKAHFYHFFPFWQRKLFSAIFNFKKKILILPTKNRKNNFQKVAPIDFWHQKWIKILIDISILARKFQVHFWA